MTISTVWARRRDRECFNCFSNWIDHEEKETDVNIALHVLRDAFRNAYDKALIVSGDSDLVPAVRMVKDEFPSKRFKIIAPYGRKPSYELIREAGGRGVGGTIKLEHLEQSLLESTVLDSQGSVVAVRPPKYRPPTV